MARQLIDALRSTTAVSASAVGVALAAVMPLLAAPGTGTAGVALAAVVMGLLLVYGRRCEALTPGWLPVRRTAGSADQPVRVHGDVTDPRHHPLRPRAPGMA